MSITITLSGRDIHEHAAQITALAKAVASLGFSAKLSVQEHKSSIQVFDSEKKQKPAPKPKVDQKTSGPTQTKTAILRSLEEDGIVNPDLADDFEDLNGEDLNNLNDYIATEVAPALTAAATRRMDEVATTAYVEENIEDLRVNNGRGEEESEPQQLPVDAVESESQEVPSESQGNPTGENLVAASPVAQDIATTPQASARDISAKNPTYEDVAEACRRLIRSPNGSKKMRDIFTKFGIKSGTELKQRPEHFSAFVQTIHSVI
jgi:hypothetical protein